MVRLETPGERTSHARQSDAIKVGHSFSRVRFVAMQHVLARQNYPRLAGEVFPDYDGQSRCIIALRLPFGLW